MYQSLGHVPPPQLCTSPWATYRYGPPTPPHHLHLGDDAGNAGDAVQHRVSPAASVPPHEPTPQHLSQHPTLNQTTLQPLQINPNPKPTRNPPQTNPEPTLNQPTKPKPTPNHTPSTQAPKHPTTPPHPYRGTYENIYIYLSRSHTAHPLNHPSSSVQIGL